MDKLTKEQRHKCMAAIKSKNTKPELIVRRFLFKRGFRYRLNHPRLPGHPDIVLRKYKTVVFVNGCFWHGHDCRFASTPKSNTMFWTNKINRNKSRDKQTIDKLTQMGWNAITVWECQLKSDTRDITLNSLELTLNKIFLINHKKSYNLEQNDLAVAAENDIDYYNNNN